MLQVSLLPPGPMWVCCWAPGSCCSGRAGASCPAAAAAATPGTRAPAAAASAAAPTDAAPPAACAYTPEQQQQQHTAVKPKLVSDWTQMTLFTQKKRIVVCNPNLSTVVFHQPTSKEY